MSLQELADVFENPRWLKNDNISLVWFITGYIPVEFTFDDTIFAVGLFPEIQGDNWAMWLRVSGHVEQLEFVKLIRQRPTSEQTKHAIVLEVGFYPPELGGQSNRVK